MSASPLKKKRAVSAYSSTKKNLYSHQDSFESSDKKMYSPPKISSIKTMQYSQLQELKNPQKELHFLDLVNQRAFRLRHFQHQKLDTSLYTHPEEITLYNTYCKETLGQPDLLSQSALNFTKKQQTVVKNREIKLFGQSPQGAKKRNKTNLKNFTSQIGKKEGKFQNLTVKVGLKNLLLGTNEANDMNFDLSEKSSPAELQDDYDVEYEDIYLQEEYSHQPEEVLKFVLKGKEYYSKNEPELLKKWIQCLPREERMEVEKDKNYFPVPHRLMMHQIDQGLNEIYGTGKNRILRPGEEASILETISRFLQECQQIDVFHRISTSNVNSILLYILKRCDMSYLTEFPLAMKQVKTQRIMVQKYCYKLLTQVECHWKIMATRFRCSDKLPSTHKLFEKYVYMAHLRGHFYQLQKKDNPLVQYLLKYSCMKADYYRMKEEIEKKNQNRRKSFYNPPKDTITTSSQNNKKQDKTNIKMGSPYYSFDSYIQAAD